MQFNYKYQKGREPLAEDRAFFFFFRIFAFKMTMLIKKLLKPKLTRIPKLDVARAISG